MTALESATEKTRERDMALGPVAGLNTENNARNGTGVPLKSKLTASAAEGRREKREHPEGTCPPGAQTSEA
ncbi:hypothetical protein GCM10010094_25840 [Streptomyces flaveus]|uniref:Uncharacterized protein n=1 Tax=Streptomyces flaveus TaxID=66370 RepID=A0A917QR22_9ACTN|nr:hypothetical protein GCM10010094_25840 [Streptomyces flaveus]